MKGRIELLSPAGGPEAGYAALACGADAIYLGLRRFSARAEAVNFAPGELGEIAAYAHSLSPRRRVFVAVNTLAAECEIGDIVRILAEIRDAGADAVIVQDLGVARIARRNFPGLELHASTQLAVHSLPGVEALAGLGFARATLARELTLDEIRRICRRSPLEIETFVHGSLCYSVSGLCLFSAFVTGRSANRGSCAQPCRCLYRAEPEWAQEGAEARGGRKYLFSLKDLALADRVPELLEAGVACLKIEGRMKGPLYSAVVTDFYRRAIDGGLDDQARVAAEEDAKTTYSRLWTRLYADSRAWNGAVDTEFPGHRGARVGEVIDVARDWSGRFWARFRPGRALERRDGLQVELEGPDKPFGFPVESMRPAGGGRLLNECRAGEEIEVPLPSGAPRVPAGAAVFRSSSQALKRRFRWSVPKPGEYAARRKAGVEISISRAGAGARAWLAAGGEGPAAHAEAVLEGVFGEARDSGAATAAAEEAFGRLGGTRFSLGELAVRNPEGLFVPKSGLNDLRRRLIAALDEALAAAQTAERKQVEEWADADADVFRPAAGRARESWSLKTDNPAMLDGFEDADLGSADEIAVAIRACPGEGIIDRVERLASRAGREKIRIALPPVVRDPEAPEAVRLLSALASRGFRKFEASNVSGFGLVELAAAGAGGRPDVRADWPVYAMNRAAAAAILSMGASGFTLSPEDGTENMRELIRRFGGFAEVVAYARPPLFLSETCVFATARGSCPGQAACGASAMGIASDFGDDLIAVNEGCRTAVVMRKPHDLSSSLPELWRAGASRFRVDLRYFPDGPKDAKAVWRRIARRQGHRGAVNGPAEAD